MDIPNYVLMTGFPSAGKSSISNYLRNKLGFAKHSSDDLREIIFGAVDYLKFQKDPNFREKENYIFNQLKKGSLTTLYMGFDTVVDYTAGLNVLRSSSLDSYLIGPDGKKYEIPCKKSLIYIRAEDNVLKERNLKRGRLNDPTSEWRYAGWDEPSESPNWDLIVYNNNTQHDLEKIFEDIDRRF